MNVSFEDAASARICVHVYPDDLLEVSQDPSGQIIRIIPEDDTSSNQGIRFFFTPESFAKFKEAINNA